MSSTSNTLLKEFIKQNDTNFRLECVELNAKEAVWDQCMESLNQDASNAGQLVDVVTCLRILTRDNIFRSKFSETILSQLVHYIDPNSVDEIAPEVCLESLKILSNIIFKQSNLIAYLKSTGILSHSIELIRSYYLDNSKRNIVLIALKTVFLLSGLDSSTRFIYANQFSAFVVFNSLFDSFDKSHLTIENTEIIMEALKAIFNIVLIIRDRDDLKTKFSTEISHLVTTMRDFLICPRIDGNHNELVSRIVHLLTVTPKRCYRFLLLPCDTLQTDQSANGSENHTQCILHSAANPQMQAIDVLLEFLDVQLESYQPDRSVTTPRLDIGLNEAVCPILDVLTRLCQSSRTIRKYCRLKILPYLGKEVTRLPEEGSTLRNRLCKLLTNPMADVSEMAAVLIFVLCKENIGRAVKYTGFGNFAGFLARHALLGQSNANKIRQTQPGEQTPNENVSDEPYSATSSDSDTEEYDNLKDNVNPVTGRWEEPKPNPMDGMTDEQKEYLAMELVQKIDQIQRTGIIQPGTVGEDGRIKPVEHILELLNRSKNEDTNRSESESD